MNSRCLRLLLFCIIGFYTLGAFSSQHIDFVVTGVGDKERENVLHRIADLYQHAPNEPISESLLKEQVEKALMPYGYFQPKVRITSPSHKRHAQIKITPGPKLTIKTLDIYTQGPGRDNAEIQHAIYTLPIRKGEAFNSILYHEAKEKIIVAAEHQGYLNAYFETAVVRIDKQNNAAYITLHFETGPRSYFGRIHFGTGTAKPTPKVKNGLHLLSVSSLLQILNPEGRSDSLFSNKRIVLSNRLLYRYIPFQYGTAYSNEKMLELSSRLKSSGYFKTVDVRPKNEFSHERMVPLEVYLEPIERFRYTVSGGYGTDTGARGRLGFHFVPVNRWGHKLDFLAQGSSNQNAAQAKYSMPGHDPVKDTYNINGGFNNLAFVSGHSRSGRLSLEFQHVQARCQQIVSLNGLHEAFRYDNKDPYERTMLYPKATLVWRYVSDPLFSPSGYNVTVTGFAAARHALSSMSVASGTLDARAAITVDALRTRFYGRTIQGITAVNDVYELPLTLAHLLGGPENLKGFSYNSIGPGKALSYGGIEVQKETLPNWYAIAFVDKGTVYRPEPNDVQYDVGAGLMWRSPVGPIKMAFAQPTNSRLNPLEGIGFRFVANMGPDL